MSTVFLNGEFLDRADARVSAFDASVQHGVGLFETMLAVRDGDDVSIARLDDHLDRLQASAAELALSDDLKTGPLGEAVIETAKKSGLDRARVRLTVTGGDLNMLEGGGRSQHQPTILIAAQPATPYPAEMFEKGVMVSLADAKANPLDPTAGHKTLNYWWRLRELQAAAAKGAGESIVFSITNHVAGGCVSNVFVVKDGELITPIARGEEGQSTIPSPVLPGITRLGVLEWAKGNGIAVTKRLVTIDDLLGADEVLLTNSSWGVLPAVRVEREEIGGGTPGDFAERIRSAITRPIRGTRH